MRRGGQLCMRNKEIWGSFNARNFLTVWGRISCSRTALRDLVWTLFLSARCSYVSRMIVTINGGYAAKQNWAAVLGNGDSLRSLFGMKWNVYVMFIKFRLQRLNYVPCELLLTQQVARRHRCIQCRASITLETSSEWPNTRERKHYTFIHFEVSGH